MIRVEVIEEFTLSRYDELKNIKRKAIETEGRLYVGDTFDCTKEMFDYLTGNNLKKKIVVKVVEIIPEVKKEVVKEKIKEKPKTTKKKKTSKK